MQESSLLRINLLHPKIRVEVGLLVNQANVILTGRSQMIVVQGLRTFAEQDALYAQGRTLPGKVVTESRAGQSYHCYGTAIDFALLIDSKTVSWDTTADWNSDHISDWMEVVHVFEKAGFQWGGSWNSNLHDLPHLDKNFGFNWRDMLLKYNDGDFLDPDPYTGYRYINLDK